MLKSPHCGLFLFRICNLKIKQKYFRFIKTLLIILFFFIGFKVLVRLLAPLMRYVAKKIQDKFKDQMDIT